MRNKYLLELWILFATLLAPLVSFGKQYTSVKTGNWNNKTTWGAASAPANTDTVTITSGFTVTTSAAATINKATVNAGGTLTLNSNLTVSKVIINNGSIKGASTLLLNGTGIVVSGTGSYVNHTGTIEFNNTPQTIDVGVVIQKNTGNLTLNNLSYPGITVTNNGQIILKGGNTVTTIFNFLSATFTMGANSVLTVSTAPLNNNSATLNASAVGCAVNYYGGNFNIKVPSADTYYDLSIDAGTKTNTVNLIMHSLTVAAGSTFTVGGFNLTLSGNWTNDGTIKTNTGTVTFNGTTAQTITDASGTAAFAKVVMSGTGTLDFASNVTTTSTFTITSGTVDATAANKNLSVAGNYTNNGTFTARKGTVTMNGAANQTLGGTSSTTFYNLTINGKTITLGNNETVGNTLLISKGTLDVSATNYNLNVGGSFTNNAAFTQRKGTVTFTGNTSTPLNINGTKNTTFYNLTTNTTNATDVLKFGRAVTVSNNFTLTKGTVDVSTNNYSLTVAGNFMNSGTFTAESGTVTLNGAVNQIIGGTSTTTFYSLTLSGKTVVMDHNESLEDVLTLNSGALNGPDTLTMISTAALTARIAPVAAAATIGADFTMQRYITGLSANYQGLSSPSKASILKDWDYDPGFYMSGVSGKSGNAIKDGVIYYSVYTFNETTNAYDSVNTDNQPLTPGLGLYLWMGNSLSSFSPFTFATHGIPNVGNINYSVTKNNKGTNLIGNPYDSPLQWTSFHTANSGLLGTTFYVFDETTGNWESSNGVTGSGGRIATNPNILPAHQGFMVVASAGGIITFKEAHKSNTDAPIIRMMPPLDMIRIALTTNANTFSGHDIIQFSDSASDNYSNYEDALYIKSHLTNVPVVYTMSRDGEELINNNVAQAEDTKEITMYAGGGDEGMYTLSFTDVNSLIKYNCVQLEDVTNGKWAMVTEGSTYSFKVEQGQMYKFVMHFKALQPAEECQLPESTTNNQQNNLDGIDIYSSNIGGQVRFTLSSEQEVIISAYSTLGQQVGQDIHLTAMDNTVDVPLPLTHGIYIIRVQTPNGVLNKRIYR